MSQRTFHIQVGDQVFLEEGGEEIGAVRRVAKDHIVIYIEGAGDFTLNGVQLNGLTTGADFGDDNKMATNYPIVWLDDGAGHVTYGRTHDFDQMLPRPSTPGSTLFSIPAGVADGS